MVFWLLTLISVLNPNVNHRNFFCFQCFCGSTPLCNLLTKLFVLFGDVFSIQIFILGFKYNV